MIDHLEHLEDLVLFDNQQTFCLDLLEDIIDTVCYGKEKVIISQKWDGSPAIIFGNQDDKIFIGTKSKVMSKREPILSFSENDISKQYEKSSEELKSILPIALKNIQKFPIQKNHWFQADILYTNPLLKESEKEVSFKTNTIEYSAKKESEIGQNILKSDIGLAIHSTKLPNGLIVPYPHIDISLPKFEEIHVVPTKIVNIENFISIPTGSRINDLLISGRSYFINTINLPTKNLKRYINECYRYNLTPNINDYNRISEIVNWESLYNREIGHICYVHNIISKIKELILMFLEKNNEEYSCSINGKNTSHEGFVVHREGTSVKLVNRKIFSRWNFLNWENRKKKEVL